MDQWHDGARPIAFLRMLKSSAHGALRAKNACSTAGGWAKTMLFKARVSMSELGSLSTLLPVDAVLLRQEAPDWRAAVRLAGRALTTSGATDATYADEMIATVEALGPYIVIAPGVALAHARPSPAVRRTGLSWVGLATPVPFGHPQNDPVRLVVGLAARNDEDHIAALATLAELLADEARRAELERAPTPAALHALIVAYEQIQVVPETA